MQKKKEKAVSILFIIVVLIIAYLLTERDRLRFKNELLKYAGHSIGVFKRLKYEKGKPILGVYFFEVDGLKVEGAKAIGGLREDWRYFVNKSFPVIYSVKDPTINKILVFPSDFSEFKIEYPDSLNWVKRLIE